MLSIAFSLICAVAACQADVVEYSRVVSVPDSADAAELYTRSKAWLFETFQDADSVIDIDGPDGLLIGGTGAATLTVQYRRRTMYQDAVFKLKVEHKDGRCRVCATDITFLVRNNMAVAAGVGAPIVRVPAENWFIDNPDRKGVKEMKAATDGYFDGLFDSFEAFHYAHPKKDDW